MTLITRDKLNSRKLALALLAFSTSTVLVVTGQLDGDQFSQIVLSIIGPYMAAQGYVDGKETT